MPFLVNFPVCGKFNCAFPFCCADKCLIVNGREIYGSKIDEFGEFERRSTLMGTIIALIQICF